MICRSISFARLISLSVVAVVGTSGSASAVVQRRHHHSSMPVYYNYAMPYGLPISYYTGVGGPVCYLPSDGRDNNHRVQN